MTVALPVAVTPSRVSDAPMAAAPGEIAVTSPSTLTIALVRSEVVNVTPVTPAIALPRESRAVAVSCDVLPIAGVSAADCTVKVVKRWATSSVTVPDTDPLVAVIMAEPLPVAVTVAPDPDPTTVATDALLVLQVTAALPSVAWRASLTTALSVRVAPIAVRAPVSTVLTATDAATGVGVGVVPPSPPLQAARVQRSATAAPRNGTRKLEARQTVESIG